jgi:hypothetical protein
MSRWLMSAGMVLTTAVVGLQADAGDAVVQSSGRAHAPESAMLVLLGVVLTVTAYQLRRRIGAPRTR